MIITSKDNDLIKNIKKLKEKKYREEYGEFIVEGSKMIQEAIVEKQKLEEGEVPLGKVVGHEKQKKEMISKQNISQEEFKNFFLKSSMEMFNEICKLE